MKGFIPRGPSAPKANGSSFFQSADSSGSFGDDVGHLMDMPGTSGVAPMGNPHWSTDEQERLDQLLVRFPAEKYTNTERYIQIAAQMPHKTARDVAMRIKWMQAQDALRKRKPGEEAGAKKSERARAAAQQQGRGGQQGGHQQGGHGGHGGGLGGQGAGLGHSSHPSSSGNMAAGVMAGLGTGAAAAAAAAAAAGGFGSTMPLDGPTPGGSGGSGAQPNSSGGAPGIDSGLMAGIPHTDVAQPLPPPIPVPPPGSLTSDAAAALVTSLMDQNYVILASFKANMAQCKVVENTELLMRYRDNLAAALQHMQAMPGIMQQMPPLPVQPNMEQAARFLPPPKVPGLMCYPGMMPGAHMGGMMMGGPPMMMPPHMMPPFPFPGAPTPGAPAAPGAAPGMPGPPGMPMPPMGHMGDPSAMQGMANPMAHMMPMPMAMPGFGMMPPGMMPHMGGMMPGMMPGAPMAPMMPPMHPPPGMGPAPGDPGLGGNGAGVAGGMMMGGVGPGGAPGAAGGPSRNNSVQLQPL